MNSKVSGLLAEPLDPVLMREMLVPGLERDFPIVLPYITAVNKAHVLMLHERGILAPAVTAPLARAIRNLEAAGPAGFTLDAGREDAYFNYEARLIEVVGADVGGRVHVARSRNDLYATIDRLRARDAALAVSEAMLGLRAALLEAAARHRDVLMPGYTHMQPAQPITFGWYLAGVAQAVERDQRRLAEAWPRLNRSPLGAGALAGTSFPIDRAATAAALGFDGPMPHAQDAVGTRDFLAEMLATLSLAAISWGRMAQDFYIMVTNEFATLDFPDRVAQTSSMMPQKRNMTALEHLKSTAAVVLGAQVSGIAAMRGASGSLVLDACRDGFHWAWQAFEEARRAMAIATVVETHATPRPERMRELVRGNFATATDLADTLVREAGLPFREAHHLVGAVVRAAMARGLTADRIDAALIAEEAQALLGHPVVLSEESVRRAVDPAVVAESRAGTGGPASADMTAMLADLGAALAADRAELAGRREQVAAAAAELEARFAALAA